MNYTTINPPQRLRDGDTVTFTLPTGDLVYTVTKLSKSGHVALKLPGDAPNRAIFSYLGITGDAVKDFAISAFGYEPMDGDKWPRSDVSDFAAQVRLVWALFAQLATFEAPMASPAPLAGDHSAIVAAVNRYDWGCRSQAIKDLVSAIVGTNLFPR